jgi:hypothetical protein
MKVGMIVGLCAACKVGSFKIKKQTDLGLVIAFPQV